MSEKRNLWNLLTSVDGFAVVDSNGEIVAGRTAIGMSSLPEDEQLRIWDSGRLIEAAPDMFEALEVIEWMGISHMGEATMRHCQFCYGFMMDGHKSGCTIGNALAKARGEKENGK